MRRLYTWLAGVAGGAAVYRVFRRHSGPVHEPDARADRDSFEAGETPVDQADVPMTDDLDARRRSVHDQARAAIDEMQGD